MTTISSAVQSDPITAQMAWVLSRAPSEVGRRLCPEQKLAKRMGVGVQQVRKSFNTLVDHGVLVRRRGSGTYVRSIPKVDQPKEQSFDLSPEVLFVDFDGQTTTDSQQRALHLGLWSDLPHLHHPNAEVLTAMVQRAEELGHYLAVHSMVQRRNQPLPISELAKRLQSAPEDGRIVNIRWAKVLTEAAEKSHLPTLFYQTGSKHVTHEPLVMFNTDEAIERAVSLFAAEGCQEVAILGPNTGLHHNGTSERRDREVCEWACQQRGVRYAGGQFVDFYSPDDLHSTGRDLLSQKVEAIYVSDDHLLPSLVQSMQEMDRLPGRDFALITLSNRDVPLPSSYQWSCLEFAPEYLGRLLVDQLIELIERAEYDVPTQAIHAAWRPGKTHQRSK